MLNNVKWQVKNCVILAKMTGNLTVEDIEAISAQIVDHLENSNYKGQVHVIVDCDQLQTMPMNPLVYINSKWLGHTKIGWLIVANLQHNLFNTLISVTMQATQQKFRKENSLEEALGYLRKVDPVILAKEIAA